MKPTASALQKFLLCAAATAVASSSPVVAAEQGSVPARITQDVQQRQRQRQHQKEERVGLKTALLYEDEDGENFHHDNDSHHNFGGITYGGPGNHQHLHKQDRDGVLLSSPVTETKTQAQETHRMPHTPCHPDLGVLACSQTGEFCTKILLPLPLPYPETREPNWDWHCVPRRPTESDARVSAGAYPANRSPPQTTAISETTKTMTTTPTKHQKERSRRLFNQFPPSGTLYDQCTYDLKYDYDYNSTILHPSGWDRCACRLYDYQLPEPETLIYTDVEYCHNVNIYYCANYYDKTLETNPNAYDACLCSTYDGKPIPDKANDFCDEIPKRYCEAYYPNGDVAGIAKCLCDTFEYQDWCNFEPPEGFVPVQQPTPKPPTASTGPTFEPTPEPTAEPTLPPTPQPTEKPTLKPTGTPTLKPTHEPTRNPTIRPTVEPTLNHTPKPTKTPTVPATNIPTVSATDKPTRKPQMSRPKATPNQTARPTAFPTRDPGIPITQRPQVPLPTPQPTRKPTPKPTPEPTREPMPEPTREPTPEPTLEPTPSPTDNKEADNKEEDTLPTPQPTRKPTPKPTPEPTREPMPEPTREPTPEPTLEPTLEPTPSPTDNKEADNKEEDKNESKDDAKDASNKSTYEGTKYDTPKGLPAGSGEYQPPPKPAIGDEGLSNVNKLFTVITSLQRQPNNSDRPGSTLRLPVHNVFVHDNNHEGIDIGV
jgi:hypothetical protein